MRPLHFLHPARDPPPSAFRATADCGLHLDPYHQYLTEHCRGVGEVGRGNLCGRARTPLLASTMNARVDMNHMLLPHCRRVRAQATGGLVIYDQIPAIVSAMRAVVAERLNGDSANYVETNPEKAREIIEKTLLLWIKPRLVEATAEVKTSLLKEMAEAAKETIKSSFEESNKTFNAEQDAKDAKKKEMDDVFEKYFKTDGKTDGKRKRGEDERTISLDALFDMAKETSMAKKTSKSSRA